MIRPCLQFLCALCALCGEMLFAPAAEGKTVTILFTGETHATLGPCDCPVEPMGGLSRRAAMVKRVRRDHPDALLVDAGGAFAGGFYDEYAQGEALDRERTEVTVRAMGRMGYDAVCVGDEELAFGPALLKQQARTVPFLSANLVDARTGAPLMPAHRIREVGGVRVGLIGLTTPEVHEGDFREAAEGLKALDPIQAAAQAVKRLRPQVDLLVVLSHLGESGSALVAQKVPGIDLLINGHRRSSGDTEVQVGQTLMVQFSYQGRHLGRVDVVLGEDGKVKVRRTSLIDLGREAPDDPEIAAEVEAFERRAAALTRVRLDLYGMGECPYCSEAEQEIHEVVKALGDRLDARFYYVVGEDAQGKLVSLHGPDEVMEDLRQIAVQRLAPGRFWAYLLSRGGGRMRWDQAAIAAGVDTAAVSRYVASGKALRELRSHLYRTGRLRIDRSPTLFINNRPYPGRVERQALLRAICGRFSPKGMPPACASLPECGSDADCVRPGFLGTCQDAGTPSARCVYRKDVAVGLTVVYDAASLFSREEEALALLRTTFPGVEVERVEASTQRGRTLIATHDIRLLPAYLFDARVADAFHFERTSKMFRRSGADYLFDGERAGSPVRVGRPLRAGALDIFLSPTSPHACAIAREALDLLDRMPKRPEVSFHYMVRSEESADAPGGRFDLEESARQAVVRALYPDRYLDYFRARCAEAGSSYWEAGAQKLGIDPARVREAAQGELGMKLVAEEAQLVKGLELKGDIAFVFNNREVVAPSGKEQFRQALARLMGTEP